MTGNYQEEFEDNTFECALCGAQVYYELTRCPNCGVNLYDLLNDGVKSFGYDHANRLVSVTDGQTTVVYNYNGSGDRLRQTVNGVTTSYTLDLNSGLTQVLRSWRSQLRDDGTRYVYGLGRLAQSGQNDSEYFLTDALGSVRQITDSTGEVMLAQIYQPFGEILKQEGEGQSPYGYTGEWTDNASGLIYLRARWYAPAQGRFTSRDTWEGDPNRPMSYNAWLYVSGNPINRRDPSGLCYVGDLSEECVPYFPPLPTPPAPDPDGLYPTRVPAGIVWQPSVTINSAFILGNDLGQNGMDQFDIKAANDRARTICIKEDEKGKCIQYEYDQYVAKACGPLTLSAIMGFEGNKLFNRAYGVTLPWEDPETGIIYPAPVTPNGTSAEELVAIAKSFSGWDAYSVTNGTFSALSSVLSMGRYPIAGVAASGKTGRIGQGEIGHWVGVSGISAPWQWTRGPEWQWVRVYNPFHNRTEYYMWDLFYSEWGSGVDFSTRVMVVVYRTSAWTPVYK